MLNFIQIILPIRKVSKTTVYRLYIYWGKRNHFRISFLNDQISMYFAKKVKILSNWNIKSFSFVQISNHVKSFTKLHFIKFCYDWNWIFNLVPQSITNLAILHFIKILLQILYASQQIYSTSLLYFVLQFLFWCQLASNDNCWISFCSRRVIFFVTVNHP